jgi:hypothetical protein
MHPITRYRTTPLRCSLPRSPTAPRQCPPCPRLPKPSLTSSLRVSAARFTVVVTIGMLPQMSLLAVALNFSVPTQFQEHTRLFNGNVLNTSNAVVLPLDAQDVSKYAVLLPYGLTTADMFAGSLSSVTSTDYRHPSRPAAMAQAVGPSMETLSLTCPRYKTSMSNRHREAMDTPACAIPPHP